LPQACNQPASLDSLKRGDESPPRPHALWIQYDGLDRDLFPVLTCRTNGLHRERLNDPLGTGIEADRGVLPDDGAVEGAGGDKEPEQRLLFERR